MRNNKKAIFFVSDAIIFLAILSVGILILMPPTGSTKSYKSNYVSEDILRILENTKVSEMNATWVNLNVANGNITDINQSALSLIGLLWSKGKITLTQETVQQVFTNKIDYDGWGVWIDGETVFSTQATRDTHVSRKGVIVSGIEKNKPVEGYLAKARATKGIRQSSMAITMPPEGSGWDNGNVSIKRYFNLSNLSISSAQLKLSIHADQTANDVQVIFNNGTCKYFRTNFTWVYSNSEGNVGTKNVTNCVINGSNVMEIILKNQDYNAHIHPGLMLLINYSENISFQTQQTFFSKRTYFDNIESYESSSGGAGAWSMTSFHIPEAAKNISVYMQIAGKNIKDYRGYPTDPCVKQSGSCDSFSSRRGKFIDWEGNWRDAKDNDYLLFLNELNPIDSKATFGGNLTVNVTFKYNNSNLSAHLRNGTNIAAVYFNNYEDMSWGTTKVQIYSNPFTDSNNSSFIELNYTLDQNLPYGSIEIVKMDEFGGAENYDKTVSFSYPAQANYKSDTYIHLVQRYSDQITSWANSFNPPTSQIFISPSSRAIPADIFIDNRYFDLSPAAVNYVRARDTGSGNIIMNSSILEKRFYLKSFVEYGEVFSTQDEAINDSLSRLQSVMGSYFSAQEISTESDIITKVPSMWGPISAEVRAWD